MRITPQNRKRALIGGVAGAVLLALYLRHRQNTAAAGTTTSTVGTLTDPTAGFRAVGAAADPTAGVGSGFDPSTLTDGVPFTDTSGLGVQAAAPTDFTPITDAISGLGTNFTDLQTQLNDLQTEVAAGVPAAAPKPTTPPPAAPPATKQGFWWTIAGKQTFIDSSKAGTFVAWLKAHGDNPDAWAANHPAAARQIGLVPPAVAPKPTTHTSSSPAAETGGAARKPPVSGVAGKKTAPVPVQMPPPPHIIVAAAPAPAPKPAPAPVRKPVVKPSGTQVRAH